MSFPQMSDQPPPRFHLHTPAVDFAQNRLPQYHPAFAHPHATFDPTMNQFAALTQPGPMKLAPAGWPPMPIVSAEPLTRPLPPEIEEMTFWATIFEKAKDRLKEVSEPDHRSELGFSIRDKTTWEEVHEQLRRARDVYDGREQGLPGKFKRGTRKVVKVVSAPIQQLIKVMPNHHISQPVLAAVNLLLDVSNPFCHNCKQQQWYLTRFQAWKEAAKVPTDADAQFNDLETVFANIDLFCTMFPNDENIFQASIDLVLAIFTAVESAIGFYISLQGEMLITKAVILRSKSTHHS
jgi:hypothetical protein